MDMLEKAEKIREKTGVSYEDAKAALEAADGDMLDAVVLLENQGKIRKPEVQYYTTRQEDTSQEFKEAAKAYEQQAGGEGFSGVLKRFFSWCAEMIKKGCENFFTVSRKGEEIMTVPVLLLVMLLIFAFWVIVPLLIAGLFFGFRYSFQGEITRAVDVNKACDKAAEACESVKQEFNRNN